MQETDVKELTCPSPVSKERPHKISDLGSTTAENGQNSLKVSEITI